MADLTLLTLVFEFMSPLVVTVVYLILFNKRRSKFIEAFIGLMYALTITFNIFYIWFIPATNPPTFTEIGGTGLMWAFFLDLVFQFVYTLQQYLIWVMVAFFAVLFGMVVLALKLTLQDPLKMRFSNLIRRIVGSEPETDGYTGLRDRLNHITFEGVEPQPLDPEVLGRAWREAWKDYLIIGLATLLPSIGAYVGDVVSYTAFINTGNPAYLINPYITGVFIFLTWIYRFGYPASNRIAKGAGMYLGERDLGQEMMRGVLGWFFRLNILLSIFLIATSVFNAFNAPLLIGSGPGQLNLSQAVITDSVIRYFRDGLIYALPPILIAIIILPLVEDFAVVLYKKAFEKLARKKADAVDDTPKSRASSIGSGIGIGTLVTGAFLGGVMGATLHFSFNNPLNPGQFRFIPGQVDTFVETLLIAPFTNDQLILPVSWTLLMLAIPFAAMLLLGILGHIVRSRAIGSTELYAFVAGVLVSVATYFLLPNMDYLLNVLPTPAVIDGELFYRLRPIIGPTTGNLLFRLALQYIVNLPTYVFTALFIMYYMEYREKWREQTGEESKSILNLESRDVYQSIGMFVAGLVIAIVAVFALAMMIDPGLLTNTLVGLFSEIGDPNGLEGVLAWIAEVDYHTPFIIIAEHNIIRTLIMLVFGPMFWAAVLWLVGVKKTAEESSVARIGLAVTVVGVVATFLWTYFDMTRGVFTPAPTLNWMIPLHIQDPWSLAAQMGLRAILVFGALALVYAIIIGARVSGGKGAGAWWFPLFLSIFALEYFIYDDQFTLIAVIVIPMFLAILYKGAYMGREEVRREDILLTYIKFSFMSIAIAEVLSTALIIGGISIIDMTFTGSALPFLSSIIPHAVIEIPTFLIAAAISLRIAKNLSPSVEQENWEELPTKTRALLTDERTWRIYLLIVFFLLVSALIEAFVTPLIVEWVLTFVMA
ncbi:MAG: stage II sporulation protein M [Promethearchaeota archaeon]